LTALALFRVRWSCSSNVTMLP